MWSYLHLDSLLRRHRRSRHLFAHRFDDALVHVRRTSPPQQLPGTQANLPCAGLSADAFVDAEQTSPPRRSADARLDCFFQNLRHRHLDNLLPHLITWSNLPASTVSFKIWGIGTSTVCCRVRFVGAQTTTEISSRFAKRLLTRRTLPDVCLAIINFGGSETTGRHRC